MKTILEYKKTLNKLESENLKLRSLISKENFFKYLSEKISALSQENNNLKEENTMFKQSLAKIQSSKTYKIWQKYNQIKKDLFSKK